VIDASAIPADKWALTQHAAYRTDPAGPGGDNKGDSFTGESNTGAVELPSTAFLTTGNGMGASMAG
jgi:hypothetical protein